MDINPEISVVVPCYNSEKSLVELTQRIKQTINKLNIPFEIIYVNDCSRDRTLSVLEELTTQYEEVTAIDLMFNVGQYKALMCGLEQSKGNYVITMDDDLQHPPEEIVRLYYFLKSKPELDAVFGKPEIKQHSTFRNLGSYVIRKINDKVFEKPKHLYMSAFRCLRRKLVETIIDHKTVFPVMGPLILKATKRIENIDVKHNARKYGKSNYNLYKLVKTTFDNIINFSSFPLKYISILGILTSGISFLIVLYYYIRYLLGYIQLPGWTSTILLINIYGGLILLSIGIIGEYLIRILQEVNNYPRFKIRQVYKKGSEQ